MKLRAQYLLLVPALLLAACSNNDDGVPFKDAAVIATRAPRYTSGAVSLVEAVAPYAAANNLAANASSDLFVRSGGDHYFVLRRYATNQISRYAADAPNTPIYTYSTQDASDGANDSNPYDLIIVSATKAYLLRYGTAKLWIVDPSATSEAGFKKSEIDLSAFDVDGVPEMSAGLLKDGKLYVALQRLEGFSAVKAGAIAVINTATDAVIDTQPSVAGIQGIELPVRNPSSLVAIPGSNRFLVAATGGYLTDYTPAYDGGIAAVNPADYSASLLLDDGDLITHAYGQFQDVAVVSSDRAYFVGSAPYGTTQTLYRFNPLTSGTPTAVTGFATKQLGALAVDPNGQLWVSRTSDEAPGVSILGFASGSETVVKDLVSTNLTPINIDFVTVPVPEPAK